MADQPGNGGVPPVPPGIDPNTGLPLLGTAGYQILDRILTLDHSRQPRPPQQFDLGFIGAPGQGPSLPWAVSATWCYASMALGLQQQHIAALEAHIANTQNFVAHLAQTLQSVIDAIDQDSEELVALRAEVEELLDGVVIIQNAPPPGEDDAGTNAAPGDEGGDDKEN